MRILNNRMHEVNQNGIFLNSVQGNNSNIIANNMIGGGFGTMFNEFGGAIRLHGCTKISIFYNSINYDTIGQKGAALYAHDSREIQVKNNIFYSTMGEYTAYLEDCSNWQSNYNVYYSSSANPFYFDGDLTTLDEFRTASGQENNSHFIKPVFVGPYDLHLADSNVNGLGTPIAQVLKDMDGENRNAEFPDPGADEIFPGTKPPDTTDFVRTEHARWSCLWTTLSSHGGHEPGRVYLNPDPAFDRTQPLTLEVLDIQGRLLHSGTVQANPEDSRILVPDTNAGVRGTAVVRLSDQAGRTCRKILVR